MRPANSTGTATNAAGSTWWIRSRRTVVSGWLLRPGQPAREGLELAFFGDARQGGRTLARQLTVRAEHFVLVLNPHGRRPGHRRLDRHHVVVEDRGAVL